MTTVEAYELGLVDGAVAYATQTSSSWRSYLSQLDFALSIILGDV